MRITSWAIVFVMIIFSFSFANRMLVNNKMEIVKEEVKYNNAIDLATMDATRDMMENMINLGTGNRESFYSVLSSVDTFFESFGLTLGYYGGDEKQTALKTYIPVVAVLANEGFYICSLEDLQKKEGANTIYYKEHVLKPRIPYSVEDKTPLLIGDNEKVRYPAEGVYINYTMGNEIKIYDSNKKKMIEGVIVDTRHYKDLMETEEYDPKGIEEILPDGTKVNFICMYSNDVYSKEGTYKGNAIYYEKSFYKVNNIRYLYEEWYINDVLVDKRTTEYTEEAYNFTKSIENLGIELGTNDSYYSLSGNYLTQGNPENTGMIDPFTGIYTIGEFHRVKNEAITNIVKEKLASYIVLHNRYLQMNNIAYTFSLPNISTQDWSRAISDVSVFAFVQGIPMLGETYYNNYGLSGAQIVERNVFYAYPGLRPDLTGGEITPTSTEFPTYYSNYDFSSDAKYLLEANGARIYYTAQAAAMAGYFPNIHSNDLVAQLDIDTNALDVELRYNRNNQVAVFGATGTTTYGPIVLTYEISPRINEPIYLQQASYMYSKYATMNYTKNRILNGGIAIGLNSYNSNTRIGTFLVDQNGTYVMAIREFGGITERSNKVNLNMLEGINFTIKAKPITYARDINGRKHAVVIIEGSDTPIFSNVDWVKKDARDRLEPLSKVNSATPTAILHIYKDGTYTIKATNGFGDRMATTDVVIKIPNANPTVRIERTPNENVIDSTEYVNLLAIAEDADGDLLTYKWEQSTDGGNTWTTLDTTSSSLPNRRYADGKYIIKVTVTDEYEGVGTATTSFEIKNQLPDEIEFAYTGNVQTVTLPKGRYKLEAWGSVGTGSLDGTGGSGGYTSGIVELDETTTLYVYIGGNTTTNNLGTGWHTFNGGGGGQAPGGGASDFRLVGGNWYDTNSLRSRILVAGGGGGGERCSGGAGGTTTGENGYRHSSYGTGYGTGGSQTKGGVFTGSIYGGHQFKNTSSGSFGMGASGESTTDSGSGGGGGYYGGGGITYANGGGGGSSFVTGYSGCDTTYRSYHKELEFTNVIMERGVNNGVGKAKITRISDIDIIRDGVAEFEYTGYTQTITLPKGKYRLEAWGAQGYGGNWPSLGGQAHPGQGGYTAGTITLTQETKLYVYVGELGKSGAVSIYNGGGSGPIAPSGGGASDIRTVGGDWNDLASLKSRILVAGGGGGDEWGYSNGGAGGGLVGGSGTAGRTSNGQANTTGGTQTSGGKGATSALNGSFGKGGSQPSTGFDCGGGGGGGYYGGGTGRYSGGGGGGSSYVNGYTGCDRTYYQSGYTFTDVVIQQGGNTGYGKVKITKLVTAWSGTDYDIGWYVQNTSASSYTISTAQELAGLALLTANIGKTVYYDDYGYANTTSGPYSTIGINFSGKTININQDIDLNNKPWTMGGTFAGTLNGNGNTITGLYLSQSGNASFMATNSGTINNLIIADSTLKSTSGSASGIAISNSGTINSCAVLNSNITGYGYDYTYAGGISATNGGLIINSYNAATVELSYKCTNVYCGRSCIGGIIASNGGTVVNCYNVGSVIGGCRVGGAVGSQGWQTAKPIVENFYNAGSLSCTAYKGFGVGWIQGGTIRYCYGLSSYSSSAVGGTEGTATITNNNNAAFSGSGTTWTLSGNVSTNGTLTNKLVTNNLVTALNAWINANGGKYNGVTLSTWRVDASKNGGKPILSWQ